MNTLFISTYSKLIIVAILQNGELKSKKEVKSNQTHSEYILNTIVEVLKDSDIDKKELNEIIAVKGPGSFTGTRLGLVVAKTLSFTLNIKIKTITSIEALGASNDNEIITIKDSKGVYYGKFNNNKLVGDIKYSLNKDFPFEKSEDLTLNIERIYKSLLNSEYEEVNEINADYIKKLDGINDN